MRRFLSCLVITAAFALSACSIPGFPGSGNITSDWPSLPEAKLFEPRQGVCHEWPASNSSVAHYIPMPCDKQHRAETIYVGQLTGAIADLKSPPKAESQDAVPAWAICSKEVSNFFGRNWLDYRLRLYVYWPSDSAWSAGARWVRCDVIVPQNMANWNSQALTQEAAFTKENVEKLALGCFDFVESSSSNDLINSPCDVPHNTEYAGSVNMPKRTEYPRTDEQWDEIYAYCFNVIAEFVGVRVSDLTTGAYAVLEDATWQGDGDNSVRCYLWLDDRKMATSAKSTRGVGIP